MNIAFIDLKKQFRVLEKDIRAGIEGVLEHGRFIMGPEIGRLEEELARFAGVEHAVACASGTDASFAHFQTPRPDSPPVADNSATDGFLSGSASIRKRIRGLPLAA